MKKYRKGHDMYFSPSAKNTKLTIQQCNKWRVIHLAKALRPNGRTSIESELELILYCCGSVFSDIEESMEENVLQMVQVRRNLNCQCPIEIPYYTDGHDPICYHCGCEEQLSDENDFLPI